MKFKYFVGVVVGNDIRYVTQVDHATETASWEDGAAAVSMSQNKALELVFGLRCNGHGAVVITAPDYERFTNSAREDWFGITRWCDEDIHNALVEDGYEPTEEAVAIIRKDCEHHCFTDAAIETGWNYIHSYISQHKSKLTVSDDTQAESDFFDHGFYIVNGIMVDLRDYVEDEKLIRQLLDDLSFAGDVSSNFEKEFTWADDDVTGDEVLESVIFAEIEKRIGKTREEIGRG